MFKYHKRTRQLTSSNQPIACLSDQQAGHVTHQTPSVSKNSSQGLSQQLSNLQIRSAINEILLINGGNLQQAEINNWLQSVPAVSGYTASYTCFNNWLQSVPTSTCYTVLYSVFTLKENMEVVRRTFNSENVKVRTKTKLVQSLFIYCLSEFVCLLLRS